MTDQLLRFGRWLDEPGTIRIGGVPDGYEARVLARALERLGEKGRVPDIVHVGRDHGRVQETQELLRFFAPWAETLHIPAWDCLPYDRVSPSNEILAQRSAALSTLAIGAEPQVPRVITLTPRAQQRRFTSDLLRVLKAQPAKQLAVAGLPQAFGEVTGREFSVWDYGATRLHTLLSSVNGQWAAGEGWGALHRVGGRRSWRGRRRGCCQGSGEGR